MVKRKVKILKSSPFPFYRMSSFIGSQALVSPCWGSNRLVRPYKLVPPITPPICRGTRKRGRMIDNRGIDIEAKFMFVGLIYSNLKIDIHRNQIFEMKRDTEILKILVASYDHSTKARPTLSLLSKFEGLTIPAATLLQPQRCLFFIWSQLKLRIARTLAHLTNIPKNSEDSRDNGRQYKTAKNEGNT